MAATHYEWEQTSLLMILVLCCWAPLGLSASRWGLRHCRIEMMVQSLSQSLAYNTQRCVKTCSMLLCSEIIWLYRFGDFLLPDLLPLTTGFLCPVCEDCCTNFLGASVMTLISSLCKTHIHQCTFMYQLKIYKVLHIGSFNRNYFFTILEVRSLRWRSIGWDALETCHWPPKMDVPGIITWLFSELLFTFPLWHHQSCWLESTRKISFYLNYAIKAQESNGCLQ